MRLTGKLDGRFVDKVTKPKRYSDGRGAFGLSLVVRKRADGGVTKTWQQRVKINAKWTTITHGKYPVVTLHEARRAALENARALFHGTPRFLPSTGGAGAEIDSTHVSHGHRVRGLIREAERGHMEGTARRARTDGAGMEAWRHTFSRQSGRWPLTALSASTSRRFWYPSGQTSGPRQ